MDKKIRAIGAGVLAALWLGLCAFAWFSPAKDHSDSERRQLAQFPTLTAKTILDGRFMNNFEDYATDQFPGRELFRQIKKLGYAVKLDTNGYRPEVLQAVIDEGLDHSCADFSNIKFHIGTVSFGNLVHKKSPF